MIGLGAAVPWMLLAESSGKHSVAATLLVIVVAINANRSDHKPVNRQ